MTDNASSVQKLFNKVDYLLAEKKDQKLKLLLVKEDFHRIAEVINRLPSGKVKTFALMPPEIQAKVVLGLTLHSKRMILPRLGDYAIARFLHFADEDDAVDVLQVLKEDRRNAILDKIQEKKRQKLEKLLKFGSETAGGLMDLNFVLVKPDFTLKDVARKIEEHIERKKQAPTVIVTDNEARIMGYAPYKELILNPRETKVFSLKQPLPLISHNVDQEKILELFQHKRSDAIGVVDENNQILGIIHARDLLRVGQMEATEDVYSFAGVSKEEHVFDPPSVAVRYRSRWLVVNLATAFLAAGVVVLFQDTISKFVVLAAYMPIIAGEGGNAATQTLAIVVRGLALHEVSWQNARQVIVKEMIAGFINGLIIGVIVAFSVLLLHGNPILGLIVGLSMIFNLIVAGIFGAFIPVFLDRLNMDPAISSSIFITTATDVFGFLTLLGMATLVLH